MGGGKDKRNRGEGALARETHHTHTHARTHTHQEGNKREGKTQKVRKPRLFCVCLAPVTTFLSTLNVH